MTDLACTEHKPVFSRITTRVVYGHLIYNKIVFGRKCVINGVYAIINHTVYSPPETEDVTIRFNHAEHVCYYLYQKRRKDVTTNNK